MSKAYPRWLKRGNWTSFPVCLWDGPWSQKSQGMVYSSDPDACGQHMDTEVGERDPEQGELLYVKRRKITVLLGKEMEQTER